MHCGFFRRFAKCLTQTAVAGGMFFSPPFPNLGFCAKQLLHFCSRLLAWKHCSLWRSRRRSHQATITNTWNTAFMMCFGGNRCLALSASPFAHNAAWWWVGTVYPGRVFCPGCEILSFKNNIFHFGCLTGFIMMISMRLTVIIMLVAFASRARSGECWLSEANRQI